MRNRIERRFFMVLFRLLLGIVVVSVLWVEPSGAQDQPTASTSAGAETAGAASSGSTASTGQPEGSSTATPAGGNGQPPQGPIKEDTTTNTATSNNEPKTKWDCFNEDDNVGDLRYIGLDNWSVGPSISAQLLKYNFATKQASFNTGVGAGASFRYYGATRFATGAEFDELSKDKQKLLKKYAVKDEDKGETDKDKRKQETSYKVPLYRIKSACRATTGDIGRSWKPASSIFSITPTIYVTKQDANANTDIAIQPAILVGFLNDLLNIGTGFNLSGPEKGKVFLLFSIGYGVTF
jgi:hypothetical protein